MASINSKPKCDYLHVPGANLYYEVRGSGPLLLMIHGGSGGAAGFEAVADLLAMTYTVVTYDRRGLSGSKLDDPKSEQTVEMQSDDACRLLNALGGGPANVFGSSGGAVVGLDLVARHPGLVRTLVAHEPPAHYLLPDAETIQKQHDDLIEVYRRDGVGAAMRKVVAELAGVANTDSRSGADTTVQRVKDPSNAIFLFEHEFPMFGKYRFDFAALKSTPTRIVIAGGTGKHFPGYRGGAAIAETLGNSVVEFPGHHGGYGSHPEEFAKRLAQVLAE
jgi:pimeloyl-ACP methyl ester carboxylesterase